MKKNKNKGFSLAEMLVALLIFGLSSIAIAMAIATSARVYTRSLAVTEIRTLSSTLSQGIMDELRYANHITLDSDGQLLSFTGETNGQNAVNLTANDKGEVVFSFANGSERPLLPSPSYLAGKLQVCSISVERDVSDPFSLCVTMIIEDKDAEVSETTTFHVVPLNPPTE